MHTERIDDETELPIYASTLVEAIKRQAAEKPDAEHIVLLENDIPQPLSFGRLLSEAEAVATGLHNRGIEPRQTVALMLPTCFDFYFSFLGVLMAGAIPVPVYPPVRLDRLEEYAQRQVGILRNARVKALITERRARTLANLLRPKIDGLHTIAQAEKLGNEGHRAIERGERPLAGRNVSPDDLAFIQYTSGSTGDPKGVALTHANLISNIRSINHSIRATDDDVAVSWLPLYHDMGLIGCWLFSMVHGLKLVSMSPLDFLRRPKRWLQALSDYGASLSPAPNFAYELALRRVRDRDLEGIDLSSWRWALNGAEPVSPSTVDRFYERFAPYGFRPETMKPVYGLAENAVALCFPDDSERPRFDAVDREIFQTQHRAVPVGDDDETEPLRFVSVGQAILDNEVRVVDNDGVDVPERQEGHIEFRGPSATPGYYRNPEATATIRTDDGWTRTGDRGYFADGDLFITGRSKDLIIKAGRNIHPTEVETAAAEVDGVRKGCVAAFSAPGSDGSREELVVVAETRQKDPETRAHLAAEVRRRVSAMVGVAPDTVELAAPHTIPKTPSGKLQRAETRNRYLTGTLVQRRPPVWVQVARLGSAAFAATMAAWMWRRRSSSSEEPNDDQDPTTSSE